MKSRGFTLIELLVVISIIALLSSVIAVSIQDARNKGKVAKVKSDFVQIRNAAELYKNDTGSYPSSISNLVPNYLAKTPSNPFYVYSGGLVPTCMNGINGYKIYTETTSGSGCGFCGSSSSVSENEEGRFFVASTANLGSNNVNLFNKFIVVPTFFPAGSFSIYNGSGGVFVYACLE